MDTFKNFTKKLNEMSISKDDYSRFDTYFEDISDFKKSLKNFDTEISLLKDNLKQIDLKDVKFKRNLRNSEYYSINFNRNISILIFSINTLLESIADNNQDLYDYISSEYFNGAEPYIYFEIDIENDRFNKFHFPIPLPTYFKNIGIGKKIILSAIDKFKFLYFNSVEDSDELKMVVESLINTTDVVSYMLDNKIFMFKDDFDFISNKLEEIFENFKPENFALDVDFKQKYSNEIVQNQFLNKIYNK